MEWVCRGKQGAATQWGLSDPQECMAAALGPCAVEGMQTTPAFCCPSAHLQVLSRFLLSCGGVVQRESGTACWLQQCLAWSSTCSWSVL